MDDDVLDAEPRGMLGTQPERDRRLRGGGKEQRAITFERLRGGSVTIWYSWATLMALDEAGTRLTALFTDYVVTLTGRNLRPLRNRIASGMEDLVRETPESRDFAGDGESIVYGIGIERVRPGSEPYLDSR